MDEGLVVRRRPARRRLGIEGAPVPAAAVRGAAARELRAGHVEGGLGEHGPAPGRQAVPRRPDRGLLRVHGRPEAERHVPLEVGVVEAKELGDVGGRGVSRDLRSNGIPGPPQRRQIEQEGVFGVCFLCLVRWRLGFPNL